MARLQPGQLERLRAPEWLTAPLYIYIYIHFDLNGSLHRFTCEFTFTCTCTFACKCTCTCTLTWMARCTALHLHLHSHVHVHAHAHVHLHRRPIRRWEGQLDDSELARMQERLLSLVDLPDIRPSIEREVCTRACVKSNSIKKNNPNPSPSIRERFARAPVL